MGSWGTWRQRAFETTSWPAVGGIKVRLATDCTGMGVPELALQAYGSLYGVSTQVAWCCDTRPSCRAFAMNNLRPHYFLADMLDRQFQDGSFLTGTSDSRCVLVSQDDTALDLYIAGTMCTPFSPKGARGGFADPKAKTFFQFFKTLATMQPRSAVLENSPGILNKRNRAQLQECLATATGYVRRAFTLRSSRFQLPQHRVRVYLVFLRRDALNVPANQAFKLMQKHLDSMEDEIEPPPFHEFFQTVGETPRVLRPSKALVTHAELCTCHAASLCKLHSCCCLVCHAAGRQTLKCKWRRHTRDYEKTKVAARKDYLRMWRTVNKDTNLKKVPDYIELAAKRGVDLRELTSPRERVLLRCLSRHQNLLKPTVVVDVSQSVQRACLRTDGLVPALGTGCGRILATSCGQFLSPEQCMWLQGINPAEINVENLSAQDLYHMAGNAMSLPVAGSVIVAALSVLKWS